MRLLRPAIPLKVKCRVAMRQLGEMWPDDVLASNKGKLGRLLAGLLERLAQLLGCESGDLRLDHNPALAVRRKVFRKGVHVGYRPDANDPEHLIYREKHAHHIKTNVRGDGAQHPDRVLIKRERRREKAVVDRIKRGAGSVPKTKVWATQPLRGANRWPPRGSRKIANRSALT